jgi:hypothetical protein
VSGLAWPARYEIRVDGVLDGRWADWFGGLRVDNDGAQTVIAGLLADQPALHGVLVKVRDLGLCLLSVRRIDPPGPASASDHAAGSAGSPDPAAGSAAGDSSRMHDPGPPFPTEVE